MVMAGPFLTGYTQTINDWYDRDIDAINEPYRPIPSGKISENEVIAQIWVLLLGGIGVSYLLDQCASTRMPHISGVPPPPWSDWRAQRRSLQWFINPLMHTTCDTQSSPSVRA